MGYLEVFDDIVKIMHEDYSGFADKAGWDRPEHFRKKLMALEGKRLLNNTRFVDIVTHYLLGFKDEHCTIKSIREASPTKTVGFRVRRYNNKLYVDKVLQEKRMKKGSVIFALDNHSIEELAIKYKDRLISGEPDKENWSTVLLKAITCEVQHPDGSIEVMRLAHYPEEAEPSLYTFQLVDGDIPCITVNDFRDLQQMEALIDANREVIEASDSIIIDVRECRGGDDSVYYPLLNYIFQPNPQIKQDGMLHYVSDRNYDNRMAMFKRLNQQNRPFVKAFIDQMNLNRNKGFVEFHFDDFQNEYSIVGSSVPKQVIILTDKYCGSSGDQFVIDASQSEKVTLIGRPTRGVIDYSNQAVQLYEEEGFEFRYATSKSLRVEHGEGLDGKGVEPTVNIPWSPKHLKMDIDLDTAIQMLRGRAYSTGS